MDENGNVRSRRHMISPTEPIHAVAVIPSAHIDGNITDPLLLPPLREFGRDDISGDEPLNFGDDLDVQGGDDEDEDSKRNALTLAIESAT